MPAGRVPGMFSAPRGRSRQPMARITALGWRVKNPSVGLVAVTLRSGPRDRTMVSSFRGMPRASLSKNFEIDSDSGIIEETGVFSWKIGEKMHGMRQS